MVKVLKFGGSSVANATNMSRVLEIVTEAILKNIEVVVVVSALKGITDALIRGGEFDLHTVWSSHADMVRRLFTGKERDEVLDELEKLYDLMLKAPKEQRVVFGEVFSSMILCRKLEAEGYEAIWLDSVELIIKGDLQKTYDNIGAYVGHATLPTIYVAPGFICGDGNGHATTLGRGGSDYSAALYAAGAGARALEIWTDVPGMMTANPKVVPQAATIPSLSYRAALELAENGAKVLYAPTVKPAMDAGIAFSIRNTFDPSLQGTVVGNNPLGGGWAGVTSTLGRICLVSEGPIREEGCALRLRDVLRRAGISAGSIDIKETLVYIDVAPEVADDAVRAIHREFFELSPLATVDLYIAGYGAVGKALTELVRRQSEDVAARIGKRLRVVGIADSKHYLIDREGLDERAMARFPANGTKGNFVDAMLSSASRGAWFVDCTDSVSLYRDYVRIREAGLNIASSNRRSLSVPYAEYVAIHSASPSTRLRYEASVGASLPMLDVLSRSAASSDEILSIEAVVSCTLNRILSEYENGAGTFAGLLRKAQADGLTERDPRMDLAGRDALMKLLILAREAGIPLEASDVQIEPVFSSEAGSVEEFYAALDAAESALSARRDEALSRGCHLRFTATLEKAAGAHGSYRAWIGVHEVRENHPAYHLEGTENAILIRTAFHPAPLLIQGAGEGARLAAATILSDILR